MTVTACLEPTLGFSPTREDVTYLIDNYGIIIATAKPGAFSILPILSNRLETLSVRIVQQLEQLRFLSEVCATT